MDDDRSLLERWRRAVAALTSTSTSTERVDDAGRRLLTAWDEPHRAYHDRAHLAETLAAFDLLTGRGPGTEPSATTAGPGLADEATGTTAGPGLADEATGPHLACADAAVGVLALWFHDAVYDPRAAAGENERSSADLAVSVLDALGVGVPERQRVGDLITMTAEHDAPTDPLSRAVHDADLWILAAPVERFDAYCDQVRREYAHVPATHYALGRSRILTALVDRPGGVYRTPTARTTWEDAAHENVRRELARLTPTPPPRLP